MFKRKVYSQLLEWKSTFNGTYAALIQGARRVGKSTVAEAFAKNEYKSYIKIDFAHISNDMLSIFNDISNLDLFFLRLQAETNVTLYKRESVIIFDEIQLYPRVRQAIKYLVADQRYDYIEGCQKLYLLFFVRFVVCNWEKHYLCTVFTPKVV